MFRSQANKHNGRRSAPLPLTLASYYTLADDFGGLRVATCCTLANLLDQKEVIDMQRPMETWLKTDVDVNFAA